MSPCNVKRQPYYCELVCWCRLAGAGAAARGGQADRAVRRAQGLRASGARGEVGADPRAHGGAAGGPRRHLYIAVDLAATASGLEAAELELAGMRDT
eukprot:1179862-Prorocentrum_minimum.AAC.2